ncbi:MAG: DHHA1 domain-containing protein [bacterium]
MPISLTGKRWLVQERDDRVVRELSEALSIEPAVAGVLFLRGIRIKEQGDIFLEPSLKHLSNPTKIPGIIPAADRICDAIRNKEKICIYGDYDVDGVTATSLMFLLLERFGADVFYFIPNRMEHGYGLHAEAIREIRKAGTDLLVTVDNGISANDEVALARALGMEVIITDHHEPPVELPETKYIINPKVSGRSTIDDSSSRLSDSSSNLSSSLEGDFTILAGVGLAFALIVAVRARLRPSAGSPSAGSPSAGSPSTGSPSTGSPSTGSPSTGSGYHVSERELPNLSEYLDLVAIGTIGDVAPLTGENRILVRHGLEKIARSKNKGIRALMRVSGLNGSMVTPGQVGFVLAPRINAAGRIGDAGTALRLLVSSDEREVEAAALILNQENQKRQEIEKEILGQVLERIEKEGRDDKVIVAHAEDWHAGVIGIVASRIVERFYRPTILITMKNGIGTGSGRSIPGFSLYEALHACREELLGFGGHRLAAGLTIDWDRIQRFRERINRYAEDHLNAEDLIPTIKVDGIIDTHHISDGLLQDLEKLKPFGMGNPEPIFVSRNVRIRNLRLVGEEHLRFQIQSRQGPMTVIGFRMKELLNSLSEDTPLDLLYHLRYNEYNGTRSIQAVLVDLMPSQNS